MVASESVLWTSIVHREHEQKVLKDAEEEEEDVAERAKAGVTESGWVDATLSEQSFLRARSFHAAEPRSLTLACTQVEGQRSAGSPKEAVYAA